MKLKKEATEISTTVEALTNAQEKEIAKYLLANYGTFGKRVAQGLFTLFDRLVPERVLANILAGLYNHLNASNSTIAKTYLNEINIICGQPITEEEFNIARNLNMKKDPELSKLIYDLVTYSDLKTLQDKAFSIREKTFKLIPSLWEEEETA